MFGAARASYARGMKPAAPTPSARSDALFKRGLDRLNADKTMHAEALLREAVDADPRHADAWHQLGVVLARQQRHAEGEQAIRRALALSESGTYRRDLAWTLLWQGRDEAAVEAYLSAVLQGVREARLFNNLGNLLKKRHDLADAEAAYRAAIETDPAYAFAIGNLAVLLSEAGRDEEAEACFRRALDLEPQAANLWQCYGAMLEHQHRLDEADAAYARGGRWEAVQYVRRRLAHWTGLEEIDQAALAMIASGAAEHLTPWSLLGMPTLTPEWHREAGRRFAESRWRGELAAAPMVARGAGLAEALAAFEAGGRLRIGYLSADFYDHATLRLLAGVLELHDAARFDIHLYSYGGVAPDADWRKRIAQWPVTIHEIDTLSDAQAAARIAQDGVHLLVDLKGYTTGARLGITALRPAPVIVSWLGYPGSLGAPRLADYLIGDATATPPVTASHYSETLALMPHSYQPNDHRRSSATRATRAEAGLPARGFVFCSLNQTFKLNAGIASIWCRLLAATPGSVLWLLDPGHERARATLHAFFAQHGVAAARVIFAPRVPQSQHLARLPLADLALDTLPYGSHTTGSDALWAGVPMVSAPGRLFAGRVGASLLRAVGLEDLIARDLDAYFQIALALANDPAWHAKVRERLARARGNAPLFDTARFTRDLERLYVAIAARETQSVGDRAPVVIVD
ncbi:Putative O-linked N-acetylglucosamine transferase (SPINDLY family) [Paraburkholderia tropica]|nr:Putative O-linked N-acetylglucosamine transferase (SPINDLY family) [Paraburkholderia tropica]